MHREEPVSEPPLRSPEGALLLQCFAFEGSERREVLERLCQQHPERAAALRKLYESLEVLGLAEERERLLALPPSHPLREVSLSDTRLAGRFVEPPDEAWSG